MESLLLTRTSGNRASNAAVDGNRGLDGGMGGKGLSGEAGLLEACGRDLRRGRVISREGDGGTGLRANDGEVELVAVLGGVAGSMVNFGFKRDAFGVASRESVSLG